MSPNDAELQRFLERAVALAAPSGIVLFGSLPVADAPVSRRRLAGAAYRAWRRAVRILRREKWCPSPSLAPGTTVPLSAAKLERWLDSRPDLEGEWLASRVGTPMFAHRADLIVKRSP